MSVTVIPDLTLISDADSAAGWTEDGAAATLESDIYYEGNGSISLLVRKNNVYDMAYDYYGQNGNTAMDMSDPDTHVWITLKSDVAAYLEDVSIRLDSTTSAIYREWKLVENFTVLNGASTKDWDGAWKTFIIPVSGTVDASAGTFDYSDVRTLHVLVDSANATFRSVTNFWIDVSYFGKGLIVTGTSFNFNDIAIVDDAQNNKYGIVQKLDGVFFINGRVTVGDGTNVTELNSSNETLAFRDTYVSSAATRTQNITDGLYGIVFSGSNTSVTADTLSILSSGDYDNNRPNFTVDDTVTAFTMAGSSIQRGDFIVFNDDCEVTNCAFNNCNTITPKLSIFQNNTVAASNHVRALEVDSGSTAWTGFSNNNFVNNTVSAATWYAYSGTYAVYSNTFDNNLYDVENSSTGVLTLNLAGTANASSSVNTNGGSTSIVATTDLTFTGLKPDTELRIYDSGLTTELYGIESATGETTYQYGTSDWQDDVVVQIFAISYEPVRLTLNLDGTDASIPIQQQFDRNYSNP